MQPFDADYVTIAVLDYAAAWVGFNPGSGVVPDLEHHTWPVSATMEELHGWVVKWCASTQITYTSPGAMGIEIYGEGYELRYIGAHGDTMHLAEVNQTPSNPHPNPSLYQQNWPAPTMVSHEGLARRMKRVMPGLNELVDFPCGCSKTTGAARRSSVWGTIQHLNDQHHPDHYAKASDDRAWTRERIAQWTEELPFDLTIDPERAEQEKARPTELTGCEKQVEDIYKQYTISAEDVKKSLGLVTEAAITASKTLGELSAKITMEMKNISPESYELMTGLKYPGDKEEA